MSFRVHPLHPSVIGDTVVSDPVDSPHIPMKLIRGAPGVGKTALVFREFKEALRSGASDLRIVVPTATLVRHFQHELARDGMVFSPHSVVSLNRFLLKRSELAQVPDGLLRAVVRDSLQRLKFPEFASVATTEGMAATVVDTIDLFENAGCTPEKLASVRKLGPHAKPFEKLWRAVGETVRQCGYHLRGDLIRAAAADTQPARVWPTHIWMDGFLAFSPIELDFLRSLVKVCDVTLTITDSPATDDIRKFALQLGAEDRLLHGNPRKPQTTLVNARTIEREADEIAWRILALHQQGTEFRRIAVALREAATYVPLLRGTFDRFGIPARFYFSSPLRKHPVAIFLGGLISGALDGWEFETAIGTLRAHPRWGRSADFDRFDFKVREAMPGRGANELLALCDSEWLREEIAVCLKTEAWRALLLTPAEWPKRFEALATNLYRPGTLDIAGDHAGIESARSHAAALRSWVDAVSSLAALPAQPVSLEDFWRVASVAIDSAVIHPLDDRANVVHVMSVYEARQWDVGSLFVCGMTDRDFPRQRPQNLLFPDSDIDRLRAAGIPLRKAADYDSEERWLFDSLRTRAVDSLVLSYPDHDASGKSLQRSRLLNLDQQAEPARLCRPAPRIAAAGLGAAGRVGSADLQAEMARLHQTISLTALEDLAQCRFKFFGGRTLSLKAAPERPGERLNARVTGSILHAALERWLAQKGRDFVEVFEETFDETCRTDHLPAGYRLEVERIQFREIARRVSARDLWTPDSSEAEVSLELEFPGPIKVKCRIDRLDTFGDTCVIVDYKSSKTARVKNLVASKTRLQGPLYALAVRENRHLNPVAMLYWAVRDDERYGWGKIPGTGLEFQPIPENWTTDARARTIARLSGFLGGEVHAHPEEAEQCRWCDFAAACRVETLVEIEKVRGA
jgi:ATP-dependent helicase/DNAse subunit B